MSQVTSPTDVALVTRLQRRVKELEQEKTRLRRDLEENEHDPGAGGDPEREMYDAIKVRGHVCLITDKFLQKRFGEFDTFIRSDCNVETGDCIDRRLCRMYRQEKV